MSTKTKISLVILAVVLITGGVWYARGSKKQITQNQENVQTNHDSQNNNKPEEAEDLKIEKITLTKCGISQKSTSILTTDKFDIFGGSSFDTAVCGYALHENRKIFDQNRNIAFLRIIEFSDDELKDSIAEGVNKGNSVNQVKGGNIDFNLGCLEEGKIVGMNPGNDYLDGETEDAILNSSISYPVALKLSFDVHPGTECVCCNLAYKIRLLK